MVQFVFHHFYFLSLQNIKFSFLASSFGSCPCPALDKGPGPLLPPFNFYFLEKGFIQLVGSSILLQGLWWPRHFAELSGGKIRSDICFHFLEMGLTRHKSLRRWSWWPCLTPYFRCSSTCNSEGAAAGRLGHRYKTFIKDSKLERPHLYSFACFSLFS